MAENVFPYPGGKTFLSEWIISHFPEHECYIEPFGGGASVMANKEPSPVEIYNDRDGDLVHFFCVLRERPGELAEWVNDRPYAKDLHEKYSHQFFDGYRPDDDIERAGRFFYLRHSQFAGKYNGYSGFSSASRKNVASKVRRAVDDLERFAERFRHVQVENRDYRDLLGRFDNDHVFWYFDPPYVEEGDALYTGEGFDHAEFADFVQDLDGLWCISYTDVPDEFDGYHIVEKDARQYMRAGQPDARRSSRTERLVLNYDPREERAFSPAVQSTLPSSVAATDGGEEYGE